MRRLFIATILLGVIASFGVLASVGSAAAADWMGWSFGISGGGGTGNSSQTDFGITLRGVRHLLPQASCRGETADPAVKWVLPSPL